MSLIGVTGCSGFLGRQLVEQLQSAGHKVVPIIRDKILAAESGAIPFGADAVIHLAARVHVLKDRHSNPEAAFFKSNVELTQLVAKAALDAGVRRFVFVSSALVMGNASPPEGFAEDAPLAPFDAYTRSKMRAEELLHSFASHGLETVVVRPPLVYGPGAKGNFRRILRAATTGLPLPVAGLRARRSMVGLRNLCDLLATAAVHPAVINASFLVADTQTVSVAELCVLLAELAGRKARNIYIPAPALSAMLRMVGRHADATRLTQPFVLRPRHAAELLDWLPPHTLREELRWTVEAEQRRK